MNAKTDEIEASTQTLTGAPITSPSAMGIMDGFPPPPDKRVTRDNCYQPEFLGWRVQNSTRLFPTARIRRGDRALTPLAHTAPLSLANLSVEAGGNRTTLAAILRQTGVDAILVLHRGRIAAEHYLGDMRVWRPHAMFSCTKSVVGLLTETLIDEGGLEPGALARRYVPELRDSPCGQATVRQLLDMQAHFKFSDAPKVDGQLQLDYLRGLGFAPRPADYAGPNGAYELLMRAQPLQLGSGVFRYDNGSTDTLAWILRKLSDTTLDELIGERIWAKLGAEQDAFIAVDAAGTEWGAGGMSACLRDFARLGEMIRCRGSLDGRRILPERIFDDLFTGGDRRAFGPRMEVDGGSYRSQFWFYHDRHRSFACRGQYGQRIWIAPDAETVVAQFGADVQLAAQEPLRLAGMQAIADELASR